MGPKKPADARSERLIAQVTGNPLAMLMLARTLLLPRGEAARARLLCDEAVRLAPDDPEVSALAQAIRSSGIGDWYFTMVRDHGRHAKYAQAFRKLLRPDSIVLDIGAGTGLFAMLAAREGAHMVIACERDPAVAAAASEVVRVNGLTDRVTIIPKDSRDLELGIDLPTRADVLLWDNLSNDLVSVGALDSIEDARRRLLRPDAAIIPQKCELRVALVEARQGSLEMGTAEGFDLTPFNRLRPTQVTLSRSKSERRSDSAGVFEFDFTVDAAHGPRRNHVAVTATGGRVNGIAQWLRFELADGVSYDTGDDEGVTAFGLQYHAVEPFEAEAGQRVTIAGAHDRLSTWFWIDPNPGRTA